MGHCSSRDSTARLAPLLAVSQLTDRAERASPHGALQGAGRGVAQLGSMEDRAFEPPPRGACQGNSALAHVTVGLFRRLGK